MDETTIDYLNKVSEFTELAEFMDDEEFTQALVMVAKMIAKPDIPPAAAAKLIVQLQVYSAKCAMMAAYYANVKKGNTAKKNVYYSAREALDKLSDALKYVARSHYG
jgi:hypothetical protein